MQLAETPTKVLHLYACTDDGYDLPAATGSVITAEEAARIFQAMLKANFCHLSNTIPQPILCGLTHSAKIVDWSAMDSRR